MLVPELPAGEKRRLKTLYEYDILDTPNEAAFDDITEMAAKLCNTKIALISLLDSDRQWFKACLGLDARETHRDISFCGHAIHQEDILEIPDASRDERFADNPLVTGPPFIRFYAGKPLSAENGDKLGTLCVIDPEPRTLSGEERDILIFLGKQVEKQLSLRLYLKQSEQSLQLIRSQTEQLEVGNQVRSQLIAVLAHDLRSPIASLEGIISAFEDELLSNDQVTTLLQALRPDLTRTTTQLNQVLQWVQQQLKAEKTSVQPCEVAAIAAKSLSWVKSRAAAKQISLRTDLEPDLWTVSQQELLDIVWRNLLSNAIKYSGRHDQVRLFAYRDGDEVVLGVKDTGLGMTSATLTALRNHQRLASMIGTDNEIGTGLGLMLCRTYLQKMDSQLHIESELDQGSCFSFRLPYIQAPH